MAHDRNLDALRGVASIVVLLAHVNQVFVLRLVGSDSSLAVAFGTMARHAVLVFFLLSGYLITQSILANIARNGRLIASEYLAARIARIYPPLLGSIALVLVLYAVLTFAGLGAFGVPGEVYRARDSFTVDLRDVVMALTMRHGMLQANGPLWSLVIEVRVYIVAMFVAMGLTGRLWPVWLACAVYLFRNDVRGVPDYLPFAAAWAMGAAAVWLRPGARTRVLVYSAAGLALAAIVSPPLLASRGDPLSVALTQLAACGVYVGLVFLTRWPAAPRWLVATADYSYSLYIIHFPLLLFVLALTQKWMGLSVERTLLVAGITVAGVLSCSYWFARYFEDQRRFKPAVRAAISAPAWLWAKSSRRSVERRPAATREEPSPPAY